jgi:MOSC domain-containing protein YiiM
MGQPEGKIVGIFLASEAGEPMSPVERVQAVMGRGLEGDRYFFSQGTFSNKPPRPDQHLTLIESEAIEAVARDDGIALGLGDARRNLVTHGVALNHLVGQRFSIGPVEVLGIRLCEPCQYLVKVTEKEILKPLTHRGGLRAEILIGGEVRIGDSVRVLGPR